MVSLTSIQAIIKRGRSALNWLLMAAGFEIMSGEPSGGMGQTLSMTCFERENVLRSSSSEKRIACCSIRVLRIVGCAVGRIYAAGLRHSLASRRTKKHFVLWK